MSRGVNKKVLSRRFVASSSHFRADLMQRQNNFLAGKKGPLTWTLTWTLKGIKTAVFRQKLSLKWQTGFAAGEVAGEVAGQPGS
jgi:hypothetical protein